MDFFGFDKMSGINAGRNVVQVLLLVLLPPILDGNGVEGFAVVKETFCRSEVGFPLLLSCLVELRFKKLPERAEPSLLA